jgi:UDP-N-acetylmuramyl pentapeptide phosphotransferase/UDP-N-acetylglucosamine-1-phosphate transferase
MGDTGSLLIGFIIAVMTIKLMTIPEISYARNPLLAANMPIVISSILFIPVFDTTRVMLVRYLEKKPIFYPDRNHIHHLLLDKGFTHIETSLIISAIAILILFTIIQCSFLLNSFWLVAIMAAVYMLLFAFFHALKQQNSTKLTTA